MEQVNEKNGEIVCGLIASFVSNNRKIDENDLKIGLQLMEHRGPDHEGWYSDERATLGHRRLAIIDLEPISNQPFISKCQRYVIVFNGEIYNFKEFRAELITRGVSFLTNSDTEVLLQLYIFESDGMLHKLRGMFAFIIWDRLERKAFVARDPYGIKPIYYAEIDGAVILASQVKALLATGLINETRDPIGEKSFWLLGSVAEPNTLYLDITPLKPGHFAEIRDGCIEREQCWNDISHYWHAKQLKGLSRDEIQERVREAVISSVKAHIVADVPVGVFLSGGIDSGVLAGLMVESGIKDLHGITISYEEFSGLHEDEVPGAKLIADHYGIQHHVRIVTKAEFQRDLPQILRAMDQPTIDGINTWYASKAVAELGLKVVVSGVGGDELFQGYKHFQQLPHLIAFWKIFSKLPGMIFLTKLLCKYIASQTKNMRWLDLPIWLKSISGAWWLRRSLYNFDEAISQVSDHKIAFEQSTKDPNYWIKNIAGSLPEDNYLALSQIESMAYLRNQLLRDSDWASMDHSVELRTPLVDSFLTEELSPFLGEFKHFPKKMLLANCLSKKLPEEILRRKKSGFGIPVATWLLESDVRGMKFNSRAVAHLVMDRQL
ncbi:asparagine synthase (glutamine-hydrolyzing) [Undibacterium sp. WLHG33]|uniref:asparagine synthase (glutamine-hydrolyzing) n=1 Tax=Undibacterium sp. WLHG33 TaxID=3412482 RepID=UPI003C306B47